MTRKKTKQLLPVIQAYAEGKTIQTKRLDGTWVDFEPQISKDIGINFENGEHRIKPEEVWIETTACEEKQTRPFKDCNELIEHYQKKYKSAAGCDIYFPSLYKPAVWVREKDTERDSLIVEYAPYGVTLGGEINRIGLQELFDNYTFLDGTPCGITE